MFEQASNIVINGGHFYYDGSTWHVGQTPESRVLDSLKRIIQKDGDFNEYSSTEQTLTLPILTKDALLSITEATTNAASRPASVSCCYDLMRRLGLLQGQQNAGLVEYEQHTPIPRVVTRNSCCCAHISRHGFVYLVSRFFQDVSAHDSPGSTSTLTVNTTIGRFRCFEIDDRTFIHFDGSTRASPTTELVDNQDLNDILRFARGQYLMMDNATFSQTEWRTETEENIPGCAAGNYFSLPNAIMYMLSNKIATWTLLRTFGRTVARCSLDFIDTLSEPASFSDQQSPDFDMDNIDTDTPAGALSHSVYICRQLLSALPTAMTHEYYYRFAAGCLNDFNRAHRHYSGLPADGGHILSTSQDRFLRMFHACKDAQETRVAPMAAVITPELQSLIRMDQNNIALVAYQLFIGLTVHWNAGRMLTRAHSVPSSWIQFLSAEDDYLYLG